MALNNPQVSIIMPTYNRAHLIAQTLESIRRQSFQEWELLIIDDGSTDSTREVIKPHLEQDPRISYYPRSEAHSKGPSGCRNQGLDLARGDYFVFFDSDDIVHPEILSTCLDLVNNEEHLFCRYDKEPFRGDWKGRPFDYNTDFEVRPVGTGDIKEMITNELAFACCTVLWNKKAIGKLRFNEELSYSEEWEYYTRILSTGISGVSINKTLYFNRKHSSSNTGEFWANDRTRRASKTKAVILVIDRLKQKGLLTPFLVRHFIQTGFFLRDPSIIDHVLWRSHAGFLKRLKYKAGFKIYPILRPLLKLKGSLGKLGKGG